MVKDRDKADTARRWHFVFAIARTWKTVEEKSIKNLVTHVPHKYYQCTRVPREHGRKGRRTFCTKRPTGGLFSINLLIRDRPVARLKRRCPV
jgi:hypothetical protein